MKAAFFYKIGDLRVEDTEIPKIGEDELLVKIKACAVCGTDLRIYNHGHFKIPQDTRRVLGHEIAGEIVEAGKLVGGYSVGMRVAIPPNVGCGRCDMCIQGLNQMCPDYEAFGISMDGGFQEYMRVPASAIGAGNVFRIPANVSFEEAALAEPLSCCYHSYQALKTEPGDVLLDIGAGPIGALHVMINRLAGASKIIVADISEKRLEIIKDLGPDIVINSSEEDLSERVQNETNRKGADIVIVACSVPSLQAQALELAAPCGRINFFGGLPKPKENVLLNTNLIHYKELHVLGTTGSSNVDYHNTIHILASRRINVKPLISERFSIEETPKAFEYAASGKGMKVLVVSS